MFSQLAAVFFVSWAIGCQGSSVSQAFERDEVVPDVLPVAGGKMEKVIVVYGDKKVDLGNELTPTEVKHKPKIDWKADPNKLYTLIMTDPDAPSRANPTRREWKHWHVVNIPGNRVEEGHELAGYVGAGPPNGTGLHRYVFLIYEQTNKLPEGESIASTSTQNRPSFKVAKWAESNGLGSPVAGNFFQAQFDDYVPILHASFKTK